MHAASELFQTITVIKVAVAIGMVVLLSVLAEVVSPRFAGILSGYPLGSAISLFFMGFEIGPEFASKSALYTMVGLIATQVFAFCYYKASSGRRLSKGPSILRASSAGLCGYFLAAALLHYLPIRVPTAILASSLSIVFFIRVLRRIDNVMIQKRVNVGPKILLLRSFFAAFFIVVVTSTAGLVGPGWAGLFAAFPITMLPFIGIIHFTYDVEHVHAILKNVPKGLGSLIVYSLVVFLAYPRLGIYIGTAVAYLFATLYLVLIQIAASIPFFSNRKACRPARGN